MARREASAPEVPYDPLTWRDPRTPEEEAAVSPMLRQYFECKRTHAGCIVLMRVGDFYEAYGEDAVTVSGALEIVLTRKDAGTGGKIPMAGVPYFSVEQYVRGLVTRGFRVAIAEQTEDPKQAKGLVKREVLRVVTSGTVLDPQMLDERRNNFIMALVRGKEGVGVAVADVTTGEFTCTQLSDETRVTEELTRWRPAEVLMDGDLPDVLPLLEADGVAHTHVLPPDVVASERVLKDYYRVPSLLGYGVAHLPSALRAAGGLLRYVQDTQKTERVSLGSLRVYSTDDRMLLDATTRRNLELCETMVGRERRGSLLWVLDQCATSMGARALRSWVERPLLDKSRIEQRHDSLEELVSKLDLNDRLRALLGRVFDLPRLLSRAVYGTANARDLLALAQSLEKLPEIQALCAGLQAARTRTVLDEIDLLQDLRDDLLGAICPDCPAGVREGGMILPGYSAELDELRDVRDSGRTRIREMEEKEREQTGIKSLKIGFNQVFGYYIEVTKSNLASVPKSYVRKQTIANGERYINDELKAYEEKILGADERIKGLEYDLFMQLMGSVVAHQEAIRENAERIAELDVLASLAHVAAGQGYVRPVMTDDLALAVDGGRHPVVERVLDAPFVPNDLYADTEAERLLIITGPNMAGKSTYLRQVALMSVMAQMGSFVPARSARLGIVDRVFTRVGASDDLHLGQSTFFVEMSETANILNNATRRSLVILDEIGRGTSTFDGLSIAWAVAEHLHSRIGCKTLFATHFHELVALEELLPGARAYRVAVKENRDDVVFLHRILPGASDKSYGIYVARLAGVPGDVLDRANAVLRELEEERHPGRPTTQAPKMQQLTLFEPVEHPLLDEIREVRLMEITPLDALNLVHKWQRRLGAS